MDQFVFVFKGVWPAKSQSQTTGPGGREAAGAGGGPAGEGGEMHRGRSQAHRSGKQLQVGDDRVNITATRAVVWEWLHECCKYCSKRDWSLRKMWVFFSVPVSLSGLLVRPRRMLTLLGATLCSRSFCVGGGRCTESSPLLTWQGMKEGQTHPAPTVRLASKELRSTRVCWH